MIRPTRDCGVSNSKSSNLLQAADVVTSRAAASSALSPSSAISQSIPPSFYTDGHSVLIFCRAICTLTIARWDDNEATLGQYSIVRRWFTTYPDYQKLSKVSKNLRQLHRIYMCKSHLHTIEFQSISPLDNWNLRILIKQNINTEGTPSNPTTLHLHQIRGCQHCNDDVLPERRGMNRSHSTALIEREGGRAMDGLDGLVLLLGKAASSLCQIDFGFTSASIWLQPSFTQGFACTMV